MANNGVYYDDEYTPGKYSDFPPVLDHNVRVSILWGEARLMGRISFDGSIVYLKCLVQFKNIKWRRVIVTQNLIQGHLGVGSLVSVWHCVRHKYEEATILRINDCSLYIVNIDGNLPISRKRDDIELTTAIFSHIYNCDAMFPTLVHPIVHKLLPYFGFYPPMGLAYLRMPDSCHPALIIGIEREKLDIRYKVISFQNNKTYTIPIAMLILLEKASAADYLSANWVRAMSKVFHYINGRGLPLSWQIPPEAMNHFTPKERIALLGSRHPGAQI